MNLFFGFQGRIGRMQWWCGQLAIFVWFVVAFLLLVAVTGLSITDFDNLSSNEKAGLGASVLLFVVAAIIPVIWVNAATTVKRYHDRDKSGFWYFIALVPYIGGIWQLVECGFLSGTPGGNSYGTRDSSTSSFDMDRDNAEDFDAIEQMINKRRDQMNSRGVQRNSNSGAKSVFGKRGN
ncbi:MAG: DUF805 domain-containing protein [Pseudomonadota bacterium]